MKLEKYTKIGSYEIVSQIGAGGMGEVYKARDSRLDREVAIKMLPSDLSKDEDRLRRFEQEAKATSALNHPNILTVFDIGEHEDSPFIVSELLEGEELRERLDESAIPLRKVTEYAQQIVSGLSAAHEKGIIHRDLKPENIFITKDDRVKILDFGLAKLSVPGAVATGSEVHTRKAMTDPGTVMGTVGYMSPEQVRGQAVDHRSDIFSFGVILYEMITGKRAFQEESLAETMSAIVKEEPPEITESNPNISPGLERIVRRCLEKKPDRRFQSTADLGFALESLSTPTTSSGSNLTVAVSAIRPDLESSRWPLRAVAATAFLLLIGCMVLGVMYIRRLVPDERPVTFVIPLPELATGVGIPTISPDGRTIAFNMTVDGKSNIYLRDLGSLNEQRLNGTEDLNGPPFWSPDSRTIAFIANEKLKKVDIGGGPVQVICDASNGQTGAWNSDGVIVFGGTEHGIRRVLASGGEVTELFPLDESRKETRQAWPRFLPDGRHFLFTSYNSSKPDLPEVFVASVDGKERKPLFKANTDVYYIAPGYLLFARDSTVMAQPFDVSKLEITGEPVTAIENVGFNALTGRSQFSISQNGTLIYRLGSLAERQLTWFDRQGKEISKVAPPGGYTDIVLSPDGKKAAVTRQVDGNSDIWTIDLERGLPTRYTFGASNEDDPAWSSDGNDLIFSSDRDSGEIRRIYRKLASGAGNEDLLSASVSTTDVGMDWSPDRKNILYSSPGEKGRMDLWILPFGGDVKPYPLLNSEFDEMQGHFSPDGRYFAYVSTESSRQEVYIQSFPLGGGKWQVSTGGGAQPHWRRDGKELYYISPERKLMAAAVKIEGTLVIGAVEPLFQTQISSMNHSNRYDVAADGQRFLVNSSVESNKQSPFNVILNWAATLKK